MPARRRDPAFEVVVDNQAVPVALRRSARARRYTLRFAPTGDFILTMPERGSEDRAIAFARAQAGWIRSRIGRLAEPVVFEPGAIIPLRGRPHQVWRAGTPRGVVRVQGGEKDGTPRILVPGEAPHLPRRLTEWLKAEARGDLEAATLRYARLAGVSVSRISVRDPVTRWGSCSASGALSFSWRLVLAPPLVLDYLAAHEVAHRREMNHGSRFWQLVRRLAPHTDEAEAWLKRHGASLHRYGVR